MPFSVRFDPDRHLIAIALEGDVGDEDLKALSRAVRAHGELAAGVGVLYDCTGVASLDVTRELIYQLGMRARNDTNPVAFVAATTAAFGLARMYQIIAGGDERMQIFSDEAEAVAWLKRS
jgi:hypothetical protein